MACCNWGVITSCWVSFRFCLSSRAMMSERNVGRIWQLFFHYIIIGGAYIIKFSPRYIFRAISEAMISSAEPWIRILPLLTM